MSRRSEGDPNRTDEELLDAITDHRWYRRGALRLLGVTAGIAALGGTAHARGRRGGRVNGDDAGARAQGRGDGGHPGDDRRDRGRGPNLDAYFGEAFRPSETAPPGLIDHTVELHIHEHAIQNPSQTAVPFHFSPTGLKIDVGDVIAFVATTPDHTITAYHEGFGRQRRVPDDKPPFSSPLLPIGGAWLYHFDVPGTYDLLCAPHEYFGMVMRVVVGDPDDDAYDGSFGPGGPPPQPRPPVSRPELSQLGITPWPFPTAMEVLTTNALSVPNIATAGTVPIGDVEADL